jgi:hypothetical protein
VSDALAITTIVTVTLAFIGYMATYLVQLRLQRRKDYLERINRQLSELYGPLYALMQAGRRAANEVMKKLELLPTDESIALSASDVPTWRSWVKTVFMPLNRQMMEVIVSSSDLILEAGFPKCLEDMLAHIACWEPVIQGWESAAATSLEPGDNYSVIDFPEEAEAYVTERYQALKSEQSKLLGRSRSAPLVV